MHRDYTERFTDNRKMEHNYRLARGNDKRDDST